MDLEFEESIKLAVQGCDAKVYDIVTTKEHKKNILRVYITSKDGVSLEKCTQVSRMISPLLDLHEPFKDEYNLEVSSPGIERKLKTLSHFQNSVNENVKIKDYEKNILKGTLKQVLQDGTITLQVDGNDIELNFSDIQSASTYFEW